jgi:hypothetical protein
MGQRKMLRERVVEKKTKLSLTPEGNKKGKETYTRDIIITHPPGGIVR